MKFLKSKWLIIIIAGAVSYIGTTLFLLTRANLNPLKQKENVQFVGSYENIRASWNFHNPELDQLIDELKKEKVNLAGRQKELNELELRLKTEYAELLQLTQTVWQLKQDFDREVIKVKEDEQSNLKKLARIYSTMAPDNAAKILNELTDEMIVKVLVFMKESESAPILEAMGKNNPADTKRAALITEKLRLASQKSNISRSP